MPRFAGLKLLPSFLRIRVCFIRDPRAEAVVVAAELDGSHICTYSTLADCSEELGTSYCTHLIDFAC